MANAMDWTPDFCLYCDKQTAEGVYCSQACRLADLEKAGTSEPVSPGAFQQEDQASLWHFSTSSIHSHASQFQLQPPVNFSVYRTTSSRMESPPTSPRSHLPHQPTYVPPTSSHAPLLRANSDYPQSKPPRALNTSSSRSSLSSIASSSTVGLSDQALSQLRSYSESFDHTRDWKRRRTLG